MNNDEMRHMQMEARSMDREAFRGAGPTLTNEIRRRIQERLDFNGQVLVDLPHDTHLVHIMGHCQVTRKPYSVDVPWDALLKWVDGEFLQDAMPGEAENVREFLQSGTSPEGWDELFPPEEDE